MCLFCHLHTLAFMQSIVDSFDGKDDVASVYIRLHNNKLFISDVQLLSSDCQLVTIKVSHNVTVFLYNALYSLIYNVYILSCLII